MPPQISVIFVLGRFSYPPPLIISTQDSKSSPTGPPGAGKSTLSALLTENFPVQHISVGDLLRRIIKNDTTHPQAGALASMLNKQELIDAKVLVPILRNELEESRARDQGRRVMLVDGFPRNLAQRREFEEVVSMLTSKLAAVLCMYYSMS
jgi:adenylate kinase